MVIWQIKENCEKHVQKHDRYERDATFVATIGQKINYTQKNHQPPLIYLKTPAF